jgi:AraC-like DNA-binding protein
VTGFFDQAHFSKQFKRHVGLTPGQFLAPDGK